MGKSNAASIFLALVAAVVSLAVLGVSIATLIQVNKTPTTNNIVAVTGSTAASGGGGGPAATTAVPAGTESTVQTTTVKKINIQPPAEITPPAPGSSSPQYTAYKSAVAYFKASVNTSADPCNDFFGYVCGNYNQEVSFGINDDKNYGGLVKNLDALVANPPATQSAAISKLLSFYTQCKTDLQAANNAKIVAGGTLLKLKLQKFIAATGNKLHFTWFSVKSQPNALPDATTMAQALAHLSIVEGIDTLVSPMVDVDYTVKKGEGPSAYKFYVDQNTLVYDKSYYDPKVFPTIRTAYENNIKALFTAYGSIPGVQTLTDAQIQKYTAKIINLELKLAGSTYSTDDTTRRIYSHFVNWYTVAGTARPSATAQIPFIDWATYVTKVFTNAQNNFPFLSDKTKLNDYQFYIMEPITIKALSTALVGNTINADDVVNYLFFRLLLQNWDLIPTASASSFQLVTPTKGFALGKQRRDRKSLRRDPFAPRFAAIDDVDDISFECVQQSEDYIQYALARVFVDNKYPTDAAKQKIHDAIGHLASSIRQGMQTMIDGLDWMDATSKVGAYAKISDLIVNVAYPDFIVDDTKLANYYANLDLSKAKNIYDMTDVLTVFAYYLQYKNLADGVPVDRHDFLGAPTTTNAWYQPELNSITFPAGILNEPYFDPDWPASLNLGAMGVVSGHELTHGFDDEGVQWNSKGGLDTWMSSDSYKNGFLKMAKCVIDEYSNFCPLKGTTYSPPCLNGANTQGENIADNGGIHSAYRAYRTHVDLNGPDPRLPDPFFGQYTHDQLYFMNFAQIWCQTPETDPEFQAQILRDPHSPSIYRVWGTIQNFPAFRTAFNCPLNSTYAPQDHCKVWVPFNAN